MQKEIKLIAISLILLICIFIVILFTKQENNLQKVYNYIVYIKSVGSNKEKYGSGFVYKTQNNRNYIITSYHVIDNSGYIEVYNTKKQKELAKLVAYDKDRDIALLSISNNLNLKDVTIGNVKKIKVGEEIYVIGTPLDIKYIATMSKGIISFIDREIVINVANEKKQYKTFQVSAFTDPGYSGGPVLDKKGKIIGMMFVKEENAEGISFALPIDYIIEIVDKMYKDNKIKKEV